MLFNSYVFIFLFLPLTYVLFIYTSKINHHLALLTLLTASLIFYCWDDYSNGIVLLSSISANYIISNKILETSNERSKKYILAFGVVFNLLLLAYYKYLNFFIDNINVVSESKIQSFHIDLPIGISFFTFTQIAYLVDAYRGTIKKYNFLYYSLFVTYFPHLIAGPIIHHKEIMHQFENQIMRKNLIRNSLIGISIFALGLFKKVIIADYLATLVIPVFDIKSAILSTTDAWIGALSYAFELYFDFSGYCDMAIGISLLFGIKLPVNFYSPYQSRNIIEFWRRWNITLSRFLRDYLYIPLGGNRNGIIKRYINLIITMILGGLWHGANWTFIVWGLLHGIYLCINHGWIAIKKYFGVNTDHIYLYSIVSRIITFISIVIAWVFFRSPDFSTALKIIYSMMHQSNITTYHWYLPNVMRFLSFPKMILFIMFSFTLTLLSPNTYQIFSKFRVSLLSYNEKLTQPLLIWKPNLLWNIIISTLLLFGICAIQSSSTFLYFQF